MSASTKNMIPPDCPECGSAMKKQTAQRGRFKGKSFWGCSNFPDCRGIVDFDSEQSITPKETAKKSGSNQDVTQIPRTWKDRVSRYGWYSEYISVGSLPSFASELYRKRDPFLFKTLSQTFFLEDKNRERSSKGDSVLMGTLLMKLLQRGYSPLCTIGIEDEIIRQFELSKLVVPTDDKTDIGFRLSHTESLSINSIIERFCERKKLELDGEFADNKETFDSPVEKQFFNQWIPDNLGEMASNWFIPQASLDVILQAHGIDISATRRVDFLFSHPHGLLVIELDGPEKKDSPIVHQERDDALATCGIEVIRVPNAEIEKMEGEKLNEIKERCERVFNVAESTSDQELLITAAIRESAFASKLQYAVARAIKYGWLYSDKWIIHVKGMGKIAAVALKDILKLMHGLDNIYGTSNIPKEIEVETDDGVFRIDSNEYSISKIESQQDRNFDLIVGIEKTSGSFHAVTGESSPESEHFIIRPAFLPITLAVEDHYSGKRVKLFSENEDKIRLSLNIFLQNIFRKKEFRTSQLDSILNILRNVDTVILLPTGAGKSFIYQLAGLLMPGITIVIDPIIALMEDQEEGLFQYGIDRIVTLSSSSNQASLRSDIKRTKNGEFQFIFQSPERLQTPEYREALSGLALTSLINLAVIDEAHCVSEWGHDFRPAYLNVSRNIRNLGKDRNGKPPPIAALTGTASRAVLRDILADLDIDQYNPECVIRPDSFDRNELKFYVLKSEQPSFSKSTLEGALRSLPDKFHVPSGEFFRTNGEKTFSGIVFVPFVGSNAFLPYGVRNTQEVVEEATNEICTIFAGKNPYGKGYWETEKRKNVRDFKYNKISLLVSTKAYGMGIDKPNIRFTIHYGIPGSLESFYQEAGRAGRNRKDAFCGIVFSEYSETRNNQLLNPGNTLEQLSSLFEENSINRSERDDVNRQLYFHLESFTGIEDEIESISNVLDVIQRLDKDHSLEITFDNDNKKKQEKALYRLTRVGVLKDYEVDYGRKTFTIHIKAFDLAYSKDALLNYVISTSPGRGGKTKKELDKINSENSKESAILLSRTLIEYIYDIIERARRTAIRSMVLMARNSADDQAIRSRILEYLQEGVGAEQIEELLFEENVNLDKWRKKIELSKTPVDATDLKSLAMRFLESYPDHPGLLLMRSITELLCQNGSETISHQDLYASIQSSVTKYELANEQWIETIDWLIDIAEDKGNTILIVLAFTFYKTMAEKIIDNDLGNYFEKVIAQQSNKDLQTIRNVFELSSFTDEIESTAQIVQDVIRDKNLATMIHGAG